MTTFTREQLEAKTVRELKNMCVYDLDIPGFTKKDKATVINAIMRNDVLGKHLQELTVDFKEANLNSLDLKCIAKFDSAAAADYYPAQSALQRAAIDTCNEFGWEIARQYIKLDASIKDK